MRKLKAATCSFLLTAALISISLTAANVTLIAHLKAKHSHENYREEHEHSGEQKIPLSHHHKNCATCQLLLGPAGKYINTVPQGLALTVEQAPFFIYCASQFIYQNKIGPLAARGPPVS